MPSPDADDLVVGGEDVFPPKPELVMFVRARATVVVMRFLRECVVASMQGKFTASNIERQRAFAKC